MQIKLGNIPKSIAPFCSSRDERTWSDLLKVYFKHPNIDDKQLLCGLRVFALELERQLIVAKVAKEYNNPTFQDEFSVKIKGKILTNQEARATLV